MSEDSVLREVSQLRVHHRVCGYDDAHDDSLRPSEWVAEFVYALGKMAGCFRNQADGPRWRRGLLELAALCVAAVESYDRKHGTGGAPAQPLPPPPTIPPPDSGVREPRRPRSPRGPARAEALHEAEPRT